MNNEPLERIADSVERIADHFDPPAEPGPRTAEEVHARLAGRVCDVLAAACDAEGRSLARGFLAKKADSGRRAALARELKSLHDGLRHLEGTLTILEADVRVWRDNPKLGIAAPMADFLPGFAAFVRETAWLARARVQAACTSADPSILAALGIIATAQDDAPPHGAAPDISAASEPEPAAQRAETQEERDARELAEMLR